MVNHYLEEKTGKLIHQLRYGLSTCCLFNSDDIICPFSFCLSSPTFNSSNISSWAEVVLTTMSYSFDCFKALRARHTFHYAFGISQSILKLSAPRIYGVWAGSIHENLFQICWRSRNIKRNNLSIIIKFKNVFKNGI